MTLTLLPNKLTRKMLVDTKYVWILSALTFRYENLRVMFTSTMAVVYGNDVSWSSVLELGRNPKMVRHAARKLIVDFFGCKIRRYVPDAERHSKDHGASRH